MSKNKKWSPIETFEFPIPPSWKIQESLCDSKSSYTSFVREAKVHHRGNPQNIYVIFHQFDPESFNYKFTIRGGRHSAKDFKLIRTNDKKQAFDALTELMIATDKKIAAANSKRTKEEYASKIER